MTPPRRVFRLAALRRYGDADMAAVVPRLAAPRQRRLLWAALGLLAIAAVLIARTGIPALGNRSLASFVDPPFGQGPRR